MKLNITRGNASRGRKIDQETAQAILNLQAFGRKIGDVAKQFGVSDAIVGNIWRRKSWTHLKRGDDGNTY